MDAGSKRVAEMPLGEYFSRTLSRMAAASQKLGGPWKYFITATFFHLRVKAGDWCS
jgi:hypothetical protein